MFGHIMAAQAAQLERILAREFRAEEKDLRRVVHPQQDRDGRAGRAEAVSHAAVADV
jgi:dephospho-CoA kinase